MGYVEVTGTEGTMIIPDPNMFTGEVKITRAPAFSAIGDDPQWESVPITGVYAERGLGVLDLARAARTGGKPLASGELGFHVLDTLVAIDEAITEERVVAVRSRVDRVPSVTEDYAPFIATL
jgi:predicted dehydrogenase